MLSPSCSHVKFSAVPTAEGWSCLFLQVLLSQFSTWEVTRDHLFPPLLFHYPGAIWRRLPQRCVDAAENRQYKITKKLHSRVLNIIFESVPSSEEILWLALDALEGRAGLYRSAPMISEGRRADPKSRAPFLPCLDPVNPPGKRFLIPPKSEHAALVFAKKIGGPAGFPVLRKVLPEL